MPKSIRAYFVLALLLAPPAAAAEESADRPCGTPQAIRLKLHGQYQEQLVAMGIQGDGDLVQIYASADGATWSAVVTSPQGKACIVAAGWRWQAVEPALPLRPDGPPA